MSLAESRTAPQYIRVLTRSDTHLPHTQHTHTLIASLVFPREGPLVVFALVCWGTVDVNTVNSLCYVEEAGTGGRTPLPSLPGQIFLYLTVTEGEPRSGNGGAPRATQYWLLQG